MTPYDAHDPAERPASPFLLLLIGSGVTLLGAEWVRFQWNALAAALPVALGGAITLRATMRAYRERRRHRRALDRAQVAATRISEPTSDEESHGAPFWDGPADTRGTAPHAAPALTGRADRRDDAMHDHETTSDAPSRRPADALDAAGSATLRTQASAAERRDATLGRNA
ncbi:MAG: hypothetical protein WD336_03180 [Trueperaceae bacterium]